MVEKRAILASDRQEGLLHVGDGLYRSTLMILDIRFQMHPAFNILNNQG